MQYKSKFIKIFSAFAGISSLLIALIYSALYTTIPAKAFIFYLQLTQPVDVSYSNAEHYLLHQDGLKINNLTINHDLVIVNFNQLVFHLDKFNYSLLKKKINYALNFSIDKINISSNSKNKGFSEDIKIISGIVTNNSYKIFYNKQPILWGNSEHNTFSNKQNNSEFQSSNNFKNHLTLDINLNNQNKIKILESLPAFDKLNIKATIDSKKINWNITAYTDYINNPSLDKLRNNKVHITGETNLKYYIPINSTFNLYTEKPTLIFFNKNATIYGIPNLFLKLAKKELTITGNVNLTNGSIYPDKYIKTKISKDVTFIKNNKDPLIKTDNKSHNKTQNTKLRDFFKDIKIDVGIEIKTNANNITFKSNELTTSLNGDLFLKYSESEPAAQLRAQGNINLLNTNYNLYGSKLNIKHGTLVYSNSPIDNPNIDITAERKVKTIYKQFNHKTSLDPEDDQITLDDHSSLPENATININITNTLHNPEIKLTSSIPLPEADKISYLLFGIPSFKVGESQAQIILQTANEMFSDGKKYNKIHKQLKNIINIDEFNFENRYVINPETGHKEYNPTVILGKNFFGDLLIRYGFSTNNPLSHISGEYKIKDSLKIQAQYNSNYGSGADIIYSKETDSLL